MFSKEKIFVFLPSQHENKYWDLLCPLKTEILHLDQLWPIVQKPSVNLNIYEQTNS